MKRQHEQTLLLETLAASKNGAKASSDKSLVYVIGADEAGRGPLIGPVVSAAACMPLVVDTAKKVGKNAKALAGVFAELNDSKKMNDAARERIVAEMKRQQQEQQNMSSSKKATSSSFSDGSAVVVAFATHRVEAGEIDELNILEASLHGMERSVDACLAKVRALSEKNPATFPAPTAENTLCLFDGPHCPRSFRAAEDDVDDDDDDDDDDQAVEEGDDVTDANDKKNKTKPKSKKGAKKATTKKKAKKKLSEKQIREAAARKRILLPVSALGNDKAAVPPGKAVVKGDSLCVTIAAASCAAKVERDRILRDEIAGKVHADFDIGNNVGYPTQKHRDALVRHGATEFHRKSYRPVAEAIAAAVAGKKRKGGKK